MRDAFPDDAPYRQPAEMLAPEALGRITAGLCTLGYGDADIRKIWGGNWHCVAAQVWK
jgi:microsomal dipeptidase-like Zn-dependent dipeptidase